MERESQKERENISEAMLQSREAVVADRALMWVHSPISKELLSPNKPIYTTIKTKTSKTYKSESLYSFPTLHIVLHLYI